MREQTNHRHNDANHYFFFILNKHFIVISFYNMVKIINSKFLQKMLYL